MIDIWMKRSMDGCTDWKMDTWMHAGMGGWMKEGRNAFFNNTLNTFYKLKQWDRKLAAATLWATLFNGQQGIFYMHINIDRIVHIIAFGIAVIGHWFGMETIPNDRSTEEVWSCNTSASGSVLVTELNPVSGWKYEERRNALSNDALQTFYL